MSQFSLRLMGEFAAAPDERPLPVPSARRIPILLAFLALNGGTSDKRDLAAQLWPGSDFHCAGGSLRHLVRKTCQWLGSEARRLTTPRYGVLRFETTDLWIDVLAFDDAVRRWRRTSEPTIAEFALGLYGGPFLPADPSSWAARERAKRERTHEELRAVKNRTFPLDPATPTSPPSYLTSLVGRRAECRAMREALARPESRLLTLWGTGGIGKTRLACAIAAESQEPIRFVDLATLSNGASAESVFALIAEGLGKPHGDRMPAEDWIRRRIGSDHWLFVFDNAERLIEGARRAAARLLADLPNLRILATSRRPLEVPGETLWSVPPLSASDAVALFLDRARASAPKLAPDAKVVTNVCQRLDGLPLAIELAAAHLRWLTPPQLLQRLDETRDVLSGGSPLAPKRHRALNDTIAGSWDLLSEPERKLFARLSIFRGGFTLEAAEAVCEANFATLSRLATHALVMPGERHRLLESLRDYAAARLAEREDPAALRARFRRYYARLFDDAIDALWKDGATEAMRLFQAERENARQALAWEAEAGGGSLAFVLLQFRDRRNELAEAQEDLEIALNSASDESYRRGLLGWKSHFLLREGRPAEALPLLIEQVRFFEGEAGEERNLIARRNGLGNVYLELDRWDDALEVFSRMRRLCLDTAESGWLPHALQGIAIAHRYRGDLEAALYFFQESLAAARAVRSELMEATALLKIARLLASQARYPEADGPLTDAEEIVKRIDDPNLEEEIRRARSEFPV